MRLFYGVLADVPALGNAMRAQRDYGALQRVLALRVVLSQCHLPMLMRQCFCYDDSPE